MCRCKQTLEFDVDVYVDEDAMQDGYDGDVEPGTDTSDWVAYQLISYARCTRCGERDQRDALGACWVTGDINAQAYLGDTVRHYGLVPAAAEFEFLDAAW